MSKYCWLTVVVSSLMLVGTVEAQEASKVDFATDIQPLLRKECLSCHGPAKQEGGLRLDRKSSVLKPLVRRVTPGNSSNSMMYRRVIGSEYGPQMPPTGELKAEQTETIKNWIEQGAIWPDSLANEMELPPLNLEAVASVDMLQQGDLTGFMKAMTKEPSLLNARGPEGSTPFMYAVLYVQPLTLTRLLKMGADPNAHNDDNATALIWAAKDFEKTRVLLAHGAKVNAMSSDFRTPLMVAARRPGGAPIVKLLLDAGADVNPNKRPAAQSSPLLEAATGGNAASFELLLTHGAKLTSDTEPILVQSVVNGCAKCVDLLVPKVTDKDVYTGALQDSAFAADARTIAILLEHGADPKAFDGFGRTALMSLATSDSYPLDAVKLLVEHGADVNAVSKHTKAGDEGMNVYDMSKRHGDNPVLAYLVSKGAMSGKVMDVALHPRSQNDMRSAIQDSLPLLQRADVNFSTRAGCVSCHNNSLAAMTIGMVRKQGFNVDEKMAAAQVKANLDSLAKGRDQLHQGFLIGVPVQDNFSEFVQAYTLIGLNAEGYKADLNTDAAAMQILGRQQSDGHWLSAHSDTRQPMCLLYLGQTALAMRALQLYAPKLGAAEYKKAVLGAANWLATAETFNNDDRSWKVTGLAWAGTNKPAMQKAMKDLRVVSEGRWRLVGYADDAGDGVCNGQEPLCATPGRHGGV